MNGEHRRQTSMSQTGMNRKSIGSCETIEMHQKRTELWQTEMSSILFQLRFNCFARWWKSHRTAVLEPFSIFHLPFWEMRIPSKSYGTTYASTRNEWTLSLREKYPFSRHLQSIQLTAIHSQFSCVVKVFRSHFPIFNWIAFSFCGEQTNNDNKEEEESKEAVVRAVVSPVKIARSNQAQYVCKLWRMLHTISVIVLTIFGYVHKHEMDTIKMIFSRFWLHTTMNQVNDETIASPSMSFRLTWVCVTC